MYLRTAEEMNRLRVNRAEEDARTDIRIGAVKLYFEDCSEAPEILGEESILQIVPGFAHVSIGTGCMDDINADDCPAPYREAFENALRYGKRYNEVVAAHFRQRQEVESEAEPFAGLPENATRTFLGPESDWPGLTIHLYDKMGPFGGTEITVQGDGTTDLSEARPDEIRYSGALDRKNLLRLLAAFVHHDFLTIELEIPTLPPDTARPRIALKHGDGREHQVKGYVAPRLPGASIETPEQRFTQIFNELLRIARVIREQAGSNRSD